MRSWDTYDFSSTQGLQDLKKAEKQFFDFAKKLSKADTTTAYQAMGDFMKRASVEESSYLTYYEVALACFLSPYSPAHSEGLGGFIAKQALADGIISGGQIKEAERVVKFSQRNRLGQQASEAALRSLNSALNAALAGTPDTSIYTLLQNSQNGILLLLFDPSCRSCSELMNKVQKDPRAKNLELVAVTKNRNVNMLDALAADYPQWNFYLATSQTADSYDFSRTPLYYIISKEGTVLCEASATLPLKY